MRTASSLTQIGGRLGCSLRPMLHRRRIFRVMSQCKNVFEAILRYGHDEDFVPQSDDHFEPTDAPAGSPEKIEVLRRRVELGQPLWHTTDRIDYSGLTGAIRPRE
jgi:hypothetical protein